MAGIYIHIPFCKQACHYCNFHFSTTLRHKDLLIEAIIKEIEQRAQQWNAFNYKTIYFGGGTPSLLPVEDIKKIKSKLFERFNIDTKAEITIEANPDDITSNKIKAYKELGINRISIGIQSFHEEDLRNLNRSHNSKQAFEAIKVVQDIGIYNISIDLIYGIPGLTDKKWKENIEKVLKFNIPHISAYALTVEPKTALAWKIKKGLYPKVSDEQSARQFQQLINKLTANNYEAYEISNFALKGYQSKHNSSYWKNDPYLGLGPGAHSYRKNIRRWNISNNIKYINQIKNKTYFEQETLSLIDRYNEYLMTGLRTKEGVDLNKIKTLKANFYNKLQEDIYIYLEKGDLVIENNHLKATKKSLFIIESIIRELFII